MPEMNVRERFREVMSFNTKVAPPKWEFGYWGGSYDHWYTQGLPKRRYPRFPKPAGTHVDLYAPCWESIKGGGLPVGIGVLGGGLYWPTQTFLLDNDVKDAMGMDKSQISVNVNLLMCPQFDVRILNEDDEQLTYVDIDGVTRVFMKETGVLPAAVDTVIKDWDSWNRLKEERLSLGNVKDRFPVHWDRLLADYRDRDYVLVLGGYPVGYFGTLVHLMGYEQLFYNYHDDPRLIHDIQHTFTELWMAIYEEVLSQTDVDMYIFWEDISAGSGSMVAPATMEEFMVPYYRRMTDFLKSHGVETIFVDTDGNCYGIIPQFLAGGVTGMYPMEASCGLDLVKVRKSYPRLQLMGGIAKAEFPKGRKRIDEVLVPPAEVLPSGGYVPFGDHLIPPEVGWEEFRYYRGRLNDLIDAVQR
jgi:hypothetical protein